MSQEGKYKYLAKNLGLLTLSSFATKLLSVFLVPLYTNILTTTEYGTYDLLNTTIGILIPILTLNITEAVFRFTLDKNYEDHAVTTVAARYFSISTMMIIVVLLVNHIFNLSHVLDDYAIYFLLMFVTQNLSNTISAYARGREYIRDLSISSVITSMVVICSNILFLVVLEWGMDGYFIANILGPLAQSIYLVLRTRFVSGVRVGKRYKKETEEMLTYSKPLIANSIAWWVNNVSDRYIITFFLGLSENGIYSVASKIPSILNILQSIFSQAWTLSAVKDYDPEDKNGFFKNTYSLYNAVMVIGCSAIILTDRMLAKFLYAKEFYAAWKYVPWLTIAIVFGALSGYLGGFFSAVKNSKIFAKSTVIGSVSNIVLNLMLTPFIGALGAAIATTVCYFVVWVMRLVHSKKFIRLRVNLLRDCVTYVLLVVQSVVLLVVLEEGTVLYGIEVVLFLLIVVFYREEIKKVIDKVLGKMRERNA